MNFFLGTIVRISKFFFFGKCLLFLAVLNRIFQRSKFNYKCVDLNRIVCASVRTRALCGSPHQPY